MNQVEIRPFAVTDYENAIALWQKSEGIGLSSADEKSAIASYLARNPNMSFVAYVDQQLVGAILCGHDGRRGYVHHLAVGTQFRRRGIGRELVSHALSALTAVGISKCHLFIFHQNESGKAFWAGIGYSLRTDIQVMSKFLWGDFENRST